MNRSNTGNQVANGMQVLSVGAFTAGNWAGQARKRNLADASSALNNMTEEQAKAVGQMRADKLNEEVRRHSNKTDGMTHLTDSEQQEFGNKKAEDLRSYINGTEDEGGNKSIDDLMSGIKSMNSPQGEALSNSINTNSEYLRERNQGQDKKTGRFVSLKQKKEGDE